MALIRSFRRKRMDRNSIHSEIDGNYTSFERDGRVFIQIDTCGRHTRQFPGKKSQTIQLNKKSALSLMKILREEFHLD
jgi:hypothetical protein